MQLPEVNQILDLLLQGEIWTQVLHETLFRMRLFNISHAIQDRDEKHYTLPSNMIKRCASLREGNPLLALGKKYSVVTIFLMWCILKYS